MNIGLDPIPGLGRLKPETTYLRVLDGPKAGERFSLAPLNVTIGRSDPPHTQVDIDLTSCETSDPPTVSRQHAELQWIEGHLELVDLSSRNGTFVNGERLEPLHPVSLRIGNKITFGNINLEVINHA